MNAAHGHLQNSTPTGGIWPTLNRLLGVLIVLVLMAIAGFRFLPEVSKRRDQQTHVDRLKAEVENERQSLVRNTRIEELLKHDPEYVAVVARDRLDLMREGETIYRLDPAKPDKARMKRNR